MVFFYLKFAKLLESLGLMFLTNLGFFLSLFLQIFLLHYALFPLFLGIQCYKCSVMVPKIAEALFIFANHFSLSVVHMRLFFRFICKITWSFQGDRVQAASSD